MEPSPAPWISALRHSHDRLRASAEPLDLAQLEQLSYASEWSIAQVLSHLGSQAEIFGMFLEAGLARMDGRLYHGLPIPACDPFVAPILYAIPIQLLAYHIAVLKGTDVDQPRNLAKSVTVE